MNTNTDPVRALIADWRESAAGAKRYSTTDYEDGYAAAESNCANRLESALATAPPSAPVGVELAALRVQEWLQGEYDILPPVQEIERAMRTPCSCADTEAALAQQPAAPSGEAVEYGTCSALCAREEVCTGHCAPLAAPQQPAGVDEARPLDDWHEDDGPVVWWTFPVNEPAWIGSPTDSDWPGYHTHWTPHPAVPPALAAQQQGGAE